MEIEVKTLTPLWTGGAETGRMERIHETGIIGSLRWWYEAIVRGLGGDVCDPTSERPGDRCPRDGDNYCRVCELFGATGQRRAFRIRLGDGEPLLSNNARIPIPSGRIHHSQRRPRAGGWFLMGESVVGDAIPLRIVPLSTTDVSSRLRLILALIDRHAAIGAKVSNGYGVLRFCENGGPVQLDALNILPIQSQPPRRHSLPDIRDFFFAKYRFRAPTNDPNWWQNIEGITQSWNGQVIAGQNQVYVHRSPQERQQAQQSLRDLVQTGLLPLAPTIRNWLRFRWFPSLFHSGRAPRVLEQYLFGYTSQQANIASKLNVSYAYQVSSQDWEFRMWGWIPCRSPDGIRLNRDQLLHDLQATLSSAATWQWVFNSNVPVPNLVEWHFLNCEQQDGLAYLKELLGLKEGGAA